MNRIFKGLIIIILSSACLVSYGQDKKTKGEKPSKELLSSYESSYNAFLDLLKEAQSDQEIHSPFAVSDYKEKYLGAIRNLDYYKKYYGKAWTIKYLDKLIDEAINRLEKHDSTNYNSLKFNDID